MAAHSRGSFSFDHAFSTAFPELFSTAAAALVTLVLKASQNRLAIAGSFSFHLRIRGLNLRLFTFGLLIEICERRADVGDEFTVLHQVARCLISQAPENQDGDLEVETSLYW